MCYYTTYYIAKGLIITSLEKLTEQIEKILNKQERLEIENRNLQIEISKLKESELNYEKYIENLNLRLEKLLNI